MPHDSFCPAELIIAQITNANEVIIFASLNENCRDESMI